MFLVFVMEEIDENQTLEGGSITKIFSGLLRKKTNSG
jgi:hypothetical protein